MFWEIKGIYKKKQIPYFKIGQTGYRMKYAERERDLERRGD